MVPSIWRPPPHGEPHIRGPPSHNKGVLGGGEGCGAGGYGVEHLHMNGISRTDEEGGRGSRSARVNSIVESRREGLARVGGEFG